jgi:excisionase family DNA binding protein
MLQFRPSGTAMLTTDQVAEQLQVTPRHVRRLNATGRMPKPVKIGRSTRWSAEVIDNWIASGCPTRAAWERMKKG